MDPKIMLCQVSKEENEIIDKMWNNNLDVNNEENFRVVTKMRDKGGTQHYIIKRTLQIRKDFQDNGNYLITGYDRYKIIDKCHVFLC